MKTSWGAKRSDAYTHLDTPLLKLNDNVKKYLLCVVQRTYIGLNSNKEMKEKEYYYCLF